MFFKGTPFILLFTLSSLALTLGKSNAAHRRVGAKRTLEGIDPESGRNVTEGCFHVYTECTEHFAKIYKFTQPKINTIAANNYEYKNILKYAGGVGYDTFCQNVYMARHCYIRLSEYRKCWTDSKIKYPLDLFNIYDYVCDRSMRNDMKKHWDCFFNSAVFDRLEKCKMHLHATTTLCDPEPIKECISEVIDSSPQCGSGAELLGSETAAKSLLILAHCPGYPSAEPCLDEDRC